MKPVIAISVLVLSAGVAVGDDQLFMHSSSAYDWTGFYLGVYGGGGVGNTAFSLSGPGGIPPVFVLDQDLSGFLGGATVGADYQMQSFVVGVAADISKTGIGGTSSASIVVPAAATVTLDTGLDWIATLRGRAGYSFDRFMPYVTGGVAAADLSATATIATGMGSASVTETERFVGFTVGAGLEYAVTDSISLSGEYRYTDLGAKTYTESSMGATLDVHPTFHSALFGANFRF